MPHLGDYLIENFAYMVGLLATMCSLPYYSIWSWGGIDCCWLIYHSDSIKKSLKHIINI